MTEAASACRGTARTGLSARVSENAHPIRVCVITRPCGAFQGKASSDAEEAIQGLRTCGADVICRDAIHQKFAIIDEKTVWYGSINLLSFGASQESIIRIVTGSAARTLAQSVGM